MNKQKQSAIDKMMEEFDKKFMFETLIPSDCQEIKQFFRTKIKALVVEVTTMEKKPIRTFNDPFYHGYNQAVDDLRERNRLLSKIGGNI